MSLEQAIVEIVSNIPVNHIFDAHTVLKELETPKYHEVYMKEYSGSIATYHGRIAQTIDNLANCKNQGKSQSHTIYGNLNECTCWKKK